MTRVNSITAILPTRPLPLLSPISGQRQDIRAKPSLAGTYSTTYMLITNTSFTDYALSINGAVLPNSTFSAAGSGQTSNTGTATVTLAAGSIMGIFTASQAILPEKTNTVLDVLRIS